MRPLFDSVKKEKSEADKMFEKLGYIKLQPIGLQRCAYTNGMKLNVLKMM